MTPESTLPVCARSKLLLEQFDFDPLSTAFLVRYRRPEWIRPKGGLSLSSRVAHTRCLPRRSQPAPGCTLAALRRTEVRSISSGTRYPSTIDPIPTEAQAACPQDVGSRSDRVRFDNRECEKTASGCPRLRPEVIRSMSRGDEVRTCAIVKDTRNLLASRLSNATTRLRRVVSSRAPSSQFRPTCMQKGDVSDIYVRLSNDFNSAKLAFQSYGFSMDDLASVP
ncbi:hypothetical protein CF319_g8076 [Tilletia indica]|nr:hypothetical protein CF319_g8076 [Tilletia indica]